MKEREFTKEELNEIRIIIQQELVKKAIEHYGGESKDYIVTSLCPYCLKSVQHSPDELSPKFCDCNDKYGKNVRVEEYESHLKKNFGIALKKGE